MPRRHFLRWASFSLFVSITLFLTAGCGHSLRNAASPPVTAASAPASPASPAAFQPYTLLPTPPPAPPVAAPRHRVLHLTRLHDHVYLADSDRHLYEAGRDTQGHIYPIYRDPATRVTYPLYYDARRDNLYRLARADGGRFYRNYVGAGRTRFYETDRDYERITPSDADRPVVTDSYNSYNYNTYNYGPNYGNGYPNNGYRPHYAGYRPPHHPSGFNGNWLWAIPVIIGAYLILQPHHSAPPPRTGPITTIVRQNTRITIINQINVAAPVGYRPIASPRPVYVYPPGYTPRPGYAPPPAFAAAEVRPHRPAVRADAPQIVPAPRAAALIRPTARPAVAASVSPAVRAAPAVSGAALRPLVRQAPPVRHVRPALFRRPAAFLARHLFIHHTVPAAPRTVPRPRTKRPRVIAPPRPAPHRVEAVKPRPMVRPQVMRPHVTPRPQIVVRPHAPVRSRPAAAPRRIPAQPVPRIARPAPAPRRPAPSQAARARPRQTRPALPVRVPEAKRKPATPRRTGKPKATAEPGRH